MTCQCTNYDLCIEQNATFELMLLWQDDPCGCGTTGAAPQPVNLTGYSAAMQIRAYSGSPTVLYDASAGITLGGAAGTIEILIPALSTANFTWWSGVYDLLLADPEGNVTRLLAGKVDVCPGVTVPIGPQFILVPGGQAINLPGGQGVLTPG